MINYETAFAELIMLIGEREFQHYKAKQRVTQLEDQIQILEKRIQELEDNKAKQFHTGEIQNTCNWNGMILS
jgi:TolA-binding protein